jgi:hypothetical protein
MSTQTRCYVVIVVVSFGRQEAFRSRLMSRVCWSKELLPAIAVLSCGLGAPRRYLGWLSFWIELSIAFSLNAIH